MMAESIVVVEAKVIALSVKQPDGRVLSILDGVNLRVAEAESVAIHGRSGSGKTSLLSILGGLSARYEGDVWIHGTHLGALGDTALTRLRRQKLGFVFQQYSLIGHLSALENVALPLTYAGAPRGLRDRAHVALASVLHD